MYPTNSTTPNPAEYSDGHQAGPIRRFKLSGGLSEGVEIVEIDNGRLRLWLLPQRGMGIWKAWVDGAAFGWQSPVRGPVHPAFVNLHEASGLGWLDGFDEMLCRCGLASNGAPEHDARGALAYPLHGRIANRPAELLAAGASELGIHVDGAVDEARLHGTKLRLASRLHTQWGAAGFTIIDRVSNLSALATQFQLLYHINFGLPLLDAGSRVCAPVERLVPRTARAAAAVAQWDVASAPQAGFQEEVHFLRLYADAGGQTAVLLKNAAGTRGVSLHYAVHELPCFTLWKNTADVADGYVLGIEPGTNFPNPYSFERAQGRTVPLAPGETHEIRLHIRFHLNAAEVAEQEAAIARIAAGRAAAIESGPARDCCADAD
ncbi:MAG: aldose 1-epimerase family protein [Rhodocyclaceae bacterium]|nr:aldose 1-epimerase family protein [Rhodocyclaceae bacterium]